MLEVIVREREGEIYGIVNSEDVPSRPPFHDFDPDNHDLPDVRTFRRRDYRDDRDFYLAMVPESTPFASTPLLQCLNYAKGSFPVEGSPGAYRLRAAMREKWCSLERLLGSAISLLQKFGYPAQPLYLTLYWP